MHFRAEYTKFIVEPVLGEGGVGGAMAVYGAFDAIVSIKCRTVKIVFLFKYSNILGHWTTLMIANVWISHEVFVYVLLNGEVNELINHHII